jgi:hypothetical protein
MKKLLVRLGIRSKIVIIYNNKIFSQTICFTKLPQLKTYEAEVIQLRGLTIEQQRSLRVTTRQTEQLQVSERLLKEEVTRLRGQVDKEKSHGICMQVGLFEI